MKKHLWLAALCALSACDAESARKPLPDWRDGYDMSVEEEPSAPSSSLQFGTYADQAPGAFAIAVPEDVRHPIRIRKLGSEDEPCGVLPGEIGDPTEIDCILEIEELDLFVQGLAFDVLIPGDGECAYLSYDLARYENWPVGEGPFEGEAPTCPFDHRERGGPNCCMEVEEDEDGVVRRLLAGRPGDCYDGAAYLQDKAELSEVSGFPLGWYVYAEDKAFVEEVRTRGLSAYYFANVPLASFFDEADHDGQPPAAMRGQFARPVSVFECEDHAAEIRARITLVVREWNEEREFERDRDAETQGVELGEEPIDDFPDLGVLTPGADTFPMLDRPVLSGGLL